jgi:hypothetical protein
MTLGDFRDRLMEQDGVVIAVYGMTFWRAGDDGKVAKDGELLLSRTVQQLRLVHDQSIHVQADTMSISAEFVGFDVQREPVTLKLLQDATFVKVVRALCKLCKLDRNAVAFAVRGIPVPPTRYNDSCLNLTVTPGTLVTVTRI